MENINTNQAPEIQGYLVSEIRICVAENTDTYIDRFKNLPRHKFNWCAAFLGTTWGGYRLMIKYSFLFWMIQMLIGTVVLTFVMFFCLWLTPDVMTNRWLMAAVPWVMITSVVLEIVSFIIRGMYADQLYWRFIRKKIDEVKNQTNSQESYVIEDDLTKHTGVYLGGAILMSIGISILDNLYRSCILSPLVIFIAKILF